MGTLSGRSREIVEMLELRSLVTCCVQESRFRGKSVRIISGRAAEYKLFWIGDEMGLGIVRIFEPKMCT